MTNRLWDPAGRATRWPVTAPLVDAVSKGFVAVGPSG